MTVTILENSVTEVAPPAPLHGKQFPNLDGRRVRLVRVYETVTPLTQETPRVHNVHKCQGSVTGQSAMAGLVGTCM